MQESDFSKKLRVDIEKWVSANPAETSKPFRLPNTILCGFSETSESRRVARETLHALGFIKRVVWVPGVLGKGSKMRMWVKV